MMPSNIQALINRKPLLLMLDYDGTLTPIVENFEQARIDSESLALLRQLSHKPWLQLAIVSGRSITQLLEFLSDLAGHPLFLVGLHGGEVYDLMRQTYIEEPSLEYKTGVATLKRYLIEQGIHQLPGIRLEDKGYSLGVHYRQASEAATQQALDALRQGWETLGLSVDFILRPGKKLLEAVPKGFNKGVGVEHLIPLAAHRFGMQPALVYAGDDVTDFDAFRVVNTYPEGYSIFVGSNPPPGLPDVAFTLPNVPSVYRVLNELAGFKPEMAESKE